MRVHLGTNKPLRGIGWFAGAFLAFAVATPADAHTPHACPADLPDAPVLTGHIEHAEIIAGKLSFDAVAAHGAALFVAQLNRCDGQGRPETASTASSASSARRWTESPARPATHTTRRATWRPPPTSGI